MANTPNLYWSDDEFLAKIKNQHTKKYKEVTESIRRCINSGYKDTAIKLHRLKKEGWERRMMQVLVYGEAKTLNVCIFS